MGNRGIEIYIILVVVFSFIYEFAVGLTWVVWLGVLGWIIKDDEYGWLAIFWYLFGMIPSIFIAFFIADLFK